MSLQLAEALKAQKKGFKLGLVDTKKDDNAQFVFTNKNGNIIDKDNSRRCVFSKAVQKAEIKTSQDSRLETHICNIKNLKR